jgi:hypothetical protein
MYWSAENPMLIHEVPPHDTTGGVWCAISATRIYTSISSVISKFTSKYCKTFRHNFLNTRPITTESVSFFFQQESVTAHTENNSVHCLDSVLVTG